MKALLISINAYPTQPLFGCVNDVLGINARLPDGVDVHIITDTHATAARILAEFTWLAHGDDAVRYLHCSGHGSCLDTDNDGLEECFLPIDFAERGAVAERHFQQLFDSIPAWSSLLVTADFCHSGCLDRTAMQQPRVLPVSQRFFADILDYRLAHPPRPPAPNVVLLSACQADQTAADARFTEGFYGAFTYCLIKIWNAHRLIAYEALREHCAQHLRGLRFAQTPQLQMHHATHPLWEWR